MAGKIRIGEALREGWLTYFRNITKFILPVVACGVAVVVGALTIDAVVKGLFPNRVSEFTDPIAKTVAAFGMYQSRNVATDISRQIFYGFLIPICGVFILRYFDIKGVPHQKKYPVSLLLRLGLLLSAATIFVGVLVRLCAEISVEFGVVMAVIAFALCTLCWGFVAFAMCGIIHQGQSVLKSIGMTWGMICSDPWRLIGFNLVAAFVGSSGAIAFGVGFVVTFPVLFTAYTAAYLQTQGNEMFSKARQRDEVTFSPRQNVEIPKAPVTARATLSQDEKAFYAKAMAEANDDTGGSRDAGLWAKAFTDSQGDTARAKATYIAFRVVETNESAGKVASPSLTDPRGRLIPVSINMRWICGLVIVVVLVAYAVWRHDNTHTIDLGSGMKMDFVWIPAINLWVGKYEVTNEQYRRFQPYHDSQAYEGHSLNGPKQPVVAVSYYDVVSFCEWLNQSCVFPKGYRARLPDGHEWSTFAQCGDGRRYPWGNTLTPEYGNYWDETANRSFPNLETTIVGGYNDGCDVACPVEQSGKNDFGLYGIGGNVCEWTSEAIGQKNVLRGASWVRFEDGGREIEGRRINNPLDTLPFIGFRVVLAR